MGLPASRPGIGRIFRADIPAGRPTQLAGYFCSGSTPEIRCRLKREWPDYWLLGDELCSVTFIHDYWQLGFQQSSITALTRMEIRASATTVTNGHDQFRNRLCEQIGKIVDRVDLKESQACTIAFGDGSSITISLKPADCSGSEAMHVSTCGSSLIVF